jgi:hypothetical protein
MTIWPLGRMREPPQQARQRLPQQMRVSSSRPPFFLSPPWSTPPGRGRCARDKNIYPFGTTAFFAPYLPSKGTAVALDFHCNANQRNKSEG